MPFDMSEKESAMWSSSQRELLLAAFVATVRLKLEFNGPTL